MPTSRLATTRPRDQVQSHTPSHAWHIRLQRCLQHACMQRKAPLGREKKASRGGATSRSTAAGPRPFNPIKTRHRRVGVGRRACAALKPWPLGPTGPSPPAPSTAAPRRRWPSRAGRRQTCFLGHSATSMGASPLGEPRHRRPRYWRVSAACTVTPVTLAAAGAEPREQRPSHSSISNGGRRRGRSGAVTKGGLPVQECCGETTRLPPAELVDLIR